MYVTPNKMSHTPPIHPPNHLSGEKSPYLLQHLYNPVDWHPWHPATFERARREGKPILLSIGYSTCHWCHVMNRESFQDPQTARLLNEHFINIKVDREERPDVDKIYMNYLISLTGQGGWPMNVFLTPELKPFYGGTYFPPRPAHGRPAFIQMLDQIAALWKDRRGELELHAGQTHSRLDGMSSKRSKPAPPPGTDALSDAAAALKHSYDPDHGGFGHAPKFPQPSQPRFLLQQAHRTGDADAIRMVLHTCERMAAGGIRDHLGGGFSRYSVDAEWLVPHFEKMLYDNAQLVQLYLDAFLISNNPTHAATVRDTLDYILRDMTHPEGGFYSAEDADSEGHEGKFYCWTLEELRHLLTPAELELVSNHYGVTLQGNFTDHSHPAPLKGQNVLSLVQTISSSESSSSKQECTENQSGLLQSANQKMRVARALRIRPHLDDKILTSWNGLMLGAMARAGIVLGEKRYSEAAERNLTFLKSRLWDAKTGILHHRWRDGERDTAHLLNDSAFLLSGLIDLYESTVDPDQLEFSITLAESMLAHFYDGENGGFWQSPDGADDLILRLKDDSDGAEPSGNGVAALALMKLAKITGREDFLQAAQSTFRLFSQMLSQFPQAMPTLLQALTLSLEQPPYAAVSGHPTQPEVANLLHAIHSVYQPARIVHGTTGPVQFPATGSPTTATPAVQICTNGTCLPPTNNPALIRQHLTSKAPGQE